MITHVDGNEIIMSAQVAHFIGAISPEESVIIQLVRDGKSVDIEVLIGNLPQNVSAAMGTEEKGQLLSELVCAL